MSKVFSILGIVFVALLLFITLIHIFVKVQGKDSPETLTALHSMPLIGGFFAAPPPSKPEPTPEELRETRARQLLVESREFFPLPDGIDRKNLDDLVVAVKEAISNYEQGLQSVERERADLVRIRTELEASKEQLEKAAKDIAERAQDLQRGREEMELRANRMAQDEIKNLKATMAIYENMPAPDAAKVLASVEIDTVAKILKGMNARKSSKIVAALDPVFAVKVTKRMQAITSESPEADTGTKESPGQAGSD